jgi:CRISPR/Cas system-associated exonuclease Cas4 (RecB family)
VALAINTLGPFLFPLIASAEKKVIGTRPVPDSNVPLRCSNYEVHGIIDVLTNITLGRADRSNLIRDCVQRACPGLNGGYEVIVDYKGSQRPRTDEPYWEQGDWQIHTYAWLRSRQSESLPVAAGILIYVNELTPGGKELQNLRRGILEGTTEVLPRPGSSDEQLIRMWRPGSDTDQLSLDFRLRRTIRVVPVTPESTQIALGAFDDVVRAVEEDIFSETRNGDILRSWRPVNPDDGSCSACDFRHFCPRPAGKPDNHIPKSPKAP